MDGSFAECSVEDKPVDCMPNADPVGTSCLPLGARSHRSDRSLKAHAQPVGCAISDCRLGRAETWQRTTAPRRLQQWPSCPEHPLIESTPLIELRPKHVEGIVPAPVSQKAFLLRFHTGQASKAARGVLPAAQAAQVFRLAALTSHLPILRDIPVEKRNAGARCIAANCTSHVHVLHIIVVGRRGNKGTAF